MTTFTLEELRDEVRRLGDFERSAVIRHQFINENLNRGLREYVYAVIDAYEGYYDDTDTPLTAANQQTVDLPEDFYRLRALDRDLGNNVFNPLRRIQLNETYRYENTGVPVAYSLHGSVTQTLPGRVRLWPVPDRPYNLPITYVPAAPVLEADGDDCDLLPSGDEVVIYAALVRLAEREERDPSEFQGQLERALARLRGNAARRDSYEPEYLSPRRPYYTEDD